MKVTQAEYEELLKNITPISASSPLKRARRLPGSFRSNLEAMYAHQLKARLHAEEITWWAYEKWKFKIGRGVWYVPDFVVFRDGIIEVHEVKGPYVRESGRIKFRAAAEAYPFIHWFWAQFKDGAWVITEEKDECSG